MHVQVCVYVYTRVCLWQIFIHAKIPANISAHLPSGPIPVPHSHFDPLNIPLRRYLSTNKQVNFDQSGIVQNYHDYITEKKITTRHRSLNMLFGPSCDPLISQLYSTNHCHKFKMLKYTCLFCPFCYFFSRYNIRKCLNRLCLSLHWEDTWWHFPRIVEQWRVYVWEGPSICRLPSNDTNTRKKIKFDVRSIATRFKSW